MTSIPATVTITDLPAGGAVTGTELFEAVQTSGGVGNSVQLTLSQMVSTTMGALPSGGGTGQVLESLGTGFAAAWTGLSSLVTASTGISISGSTTLAVGLATASGLSVLGVAGTTQTNPLPIVGTGAQVLRVNDAGTALGFGALNLASAAAVTGVLPVANGGSGTTSLTSGAILLGNGAAAITPSVITVNSTGVMAGVSVIPTGTNGPARLLATRFSDLLNLKDFGATGNGTTDDSAAVQSWLSSLGPQVGGYAPEGTYKISTTLNIATSGVGIVGAGPYQTIFNYAGASTAADIFVFGNGTTGCSNVYMQGFKVISTTVMTGGSAFHLKGLQRSQLRDLVADGQDGTGKLFHGFWFDGADMVRLDGFESKAAGGDGIRVSGGTAGIADLIIRGGKIGGSVVGLRIGGGFGGFIFDDTDVISNGINLLIDQTLTSAVNRELFFGKGALFDSSTSGPGVSIVATGTPGAYVQFDGSWIASSTTHGLSIGTSVPYIINITGGTIFNNQQDGINDNSQGSAVINISGTRIAANGLGGSGFGINPTTGTCNIGISGIYFANNTSADYSTSLFNSKLPLYDQGNRSWTPGITFANGSTGVTYSRQAGHYQLMGHAVYAEFGIILTSKGTSTGTLSVTGLPVTSSSASSSQDKGLIVLGLNLATSMPIIGLIGQSAVTIPLFNATAIGGVLDSAVSNTSSFAGAVTYSR